MAWHQKGRRIKRMEESDVASKQRHHAVVSGIGENRNPAHIGSGENAGEEGNVA